jgi:hypothetical protein
MSGNSPALPSSSKTVTPLLSLKIVKKDGAKPFVSYLLYSLLVEFPDGTCREYDLLGHDSKRLEEELLDPNRLFDFLTSVCGSLRQQQAVVSLPLKRTM